MRALGVLPSVAILFGTSLMTISAFSATETMPQVGQTAPEFTLPSQDGSNISLKDFRGKYVVLYFYPKDKTTGCTIEAHNFQRDLSKYDQANAVIVGVSVDTAESHKEFCAEQSLTFKLLSDTDKKVVEQYGSMMEMRGNKIAARNTFLIDPQGKIVKEWTGVKPQSHSEEVLEALNSLPKK
jgi:thioredoxin-dependent peroxiredoxin